jgi:hypothetical protein
MKLEQMYPDFNSLCYDGKTAFIRAYRAKRAGELVILPPKPVVRKAATNKISEEDKALLKKFGITARTLSNLQVDEEPDEGSFEFDDTYGNNEEEAE